MNPLLFGSRERQLFGVHSPPGANRKRRGAVICPPWGPEYPRAHRACRHLGERLAERGWDVLRFDYYGTGDSGGDAEDVTLEGAVADTLAAVDELCALAEVRRVTVVGLRLGAAIAHRAASTSRAVDRLVMWDPVADGAAYLRELGAPAGAAHNAAAVGGFPMSARLRAEIDALRPDAFDPVPARVLVVSSDGAEKHGRLAARVGTADRPASVESRPGPTAWADQAALGVGAIPTEALAHIVEWMDGTA